METMRERFTATVTELLDDDPRVALVTADIGVSNFVVSGAKRRHPDRVINVGIREQLMTSVAAGLAIEGFRPITHSYAPFLVERPFEQVKLDFSHQDVGAILVSVGASYDWPEGGRTHQSPGDVALISTLPDFTIYVPGHPDEVEAILRRHARDDRRVYVRMSTQQNELSIPEATETVVTILPANSDAPLVLAVGPMLDNVLAAVEELDVAVAYTTKVNPIDAAALQTWQGQQLIVVEPYLAGTSAHNVTAALNRPIHLTSIGMGRQELRNYGTPKDHEKAWGLDPDGLRKRIRAVLSTNY